MRKIKRYKDRAVMLRGRSTVCASLGAIIVFMLAFTPSAFSSADQLTVERILAENKSYIEFMDACITNFGEAKVSQYKEIYQMYFNAEVAFLQSDYKGSFKRIYSLQGKFAELISDVLKNSYLESSGNNQIQEHKGKTVPHPRLP